MLVSRKHKALILRLRDPNRVLSVIPKAKIIHADGKEFVAVKHGPEEVRVLNNIGLAAPSPINYYYDWPGRFTPFAHQKSIAEFMSGYDRCYNLSDLGTGKTLGTLWAYDFLRQCGVVKKALVISPLSTLERTWADEIFNHFSHLTCAVLHGSREKRFRLLEQDVDVYLINHDGIKVSGFVEAMAKRPDIDLIIVDELAQVGRTAGTDRFKAIVNICNKKETPRRVWGLTGTPTPNAPTDAWAQCRIVTPSTVPPYFNRFKDRVMRQISQFVWVPKPEALDVVHEVMQPSIRFHRDECIDLPECTYQTREVELSGEQKTAYKDMLTKLKAEINAGEVLAVNEAVKAQKLIQIACLCYNTPVLTSAGWVPIQDVAPHHLVWDGVEWVSQKGVAFKGVKPVVSIDGVLMTLDHRVLTNSGWSTAEEIIDGNASERFNRVAVRLPNRYPEGRDYDGGDSVRNLAVQVRLREGGCQKEPVSAYEAAHAPAQLWVPPREHDTRQDAHPAVQHLVKNETAVPESFRQRLAQVWRSGHNCLRSLAGVVREFLAGHERRVQQFAFAGPHGQRRTLFSRELPLGDSDAAEQQPTQQQTHKHAERSHDSNTSCTGVRAEESHAGGPSWSVQMGYAAGAYRTYDLIDCGPRNRFVVRGADGQLLVVHNCGVAYGDGGESLVMDAKARMEAVVEVIEEAPAKVIVFVPFVAVIERVADYLKGKGFTVATVHGGVSKHERDTIFGDFQRAHDPRVIVAQPAAMSHGLTLTAANTIVWYAPIPSNDIFEQANARITRPGQKFKQLIVMIEGTDIERKYYKRLKEKQKVQGLLLDMMRDQRLLV